MIVLDPDCALLIICFFTFGWGLNYNLLFVSWGHLHTCFFNGFLFCVGFVFVASLGLICLGLLVSNEEFFNVV